MKILRLLLLAAGALVLSVGLFAAESPKTNIQRPTTKRLSIDVPGEVSAVFWSPSRDDAHGCAIQISFTPVPEGKPQPAHPKTQVWLLKGDGTVILPIGAPATVGIGGFGSVTESVSYGYKRSAAADAIAVVVSIGERLFVERLGNGPR